MVNDTYHQLSLLGDKVQGGCLTRAESEKFKSAWEEYIDRAEQEIPSLVQELFDLTEAGASAINPIIIDS